MRSRGRRRHALRLTDPDSVDADRLERLVDDGEAALDAGAAAQAADVLQAASELWRGPALQGVAYEPYAAAEVARLEERRLACRGARIEAQLALGHERLVWTGQIARGAAARSSDLSRAAQRFAVRRAAVVG